MSAATSRSGATAAICPFRLEIEEQQVTDLFRRLGPTRWPSKELVADRFPLSPLERSCLTAPAKKLFSLLPSTGIASTHEKGKEILTSSTAAMEADLAVNPFHVDIAEEAIVDLGQRIAAWRPPEREPVDDQSQGVQLATVRPDRAPVLMSRAPAGGDVTVRTRMTRSVVPLSAALNSELGANDRLEWTWPS